MKSPTKPTRRRVWIGTLLLACTLGITGLTILAPDAEASTLFGTKKPKAVADPDNNSVELGVRFSSTVAGSVRGVRFFKDSENVGQHIGSLWSPTGAKLATAQFRQETPSGWQVALFDKPVAIEKSLTYTASYLAPSGKYSAEGRAFDTSYRKGTLSVPRGGGVYKYGHGGYPTDVWQNSNYFVDIVFTAGQAPPASPSPSKAGSPKSTQPTAVPSSTASASGTPARPSQPSDNTQLKLDKIPWEGGPAYWKKFAKTDAAGWDDPSFFPIIAWFNGVSSDEEVKYDKSLGINTYIEMWEGTPYHLFEDNGVFWAGGKLNETFTDDSKNWVGFFLDDEVDGRYTPAAGHARLKELAAKWGGHGRFTYANFTQMVMSRDMAASDAQKYVNDSIDVASLDMYWYTIPYCSNEPYRDPYVTPVNQKFCRTSSSYGKSMDSLRVRDASDGKLKPLWQWVENMNGGPGEGPFTGNITPGQLKGAVMSSVINEARGIAYFNQSHTGTCQGGAIFRQSQVTTGFCGAAQVAAAKQVNTQIHTLARVINTQSYDYSFGSGLDTMLKAQDGSVYVFAMVDGNAAPGSRRLQLPAEVRGRSAEVLFENRTVPVDGTGQFNDTFANEYTYHIYKISKNG